jgi:hypothetical protein
MQGRIEDMARASRQDRAYARTNLKSNGTRGQ